MQFGGTLARILRSVRRANPLCGPTRLSKHDIKDGCCRMFLRARDCPQLAITLPHCESKEPLVAVPMALTMGWVDSPMSFCVMSETTADEANRRFALAPRHCPRHRLSSIAEENDDITKEARPLDNPADDLTEPLGWVLHGRHAGRFMGHFSIR